MLGWMGVVLSGVEGGADVDGSAYGNFEVVLKNMCESVCDHTTSQHMHSQINVYTSKYPCIHLHTTQLRSVHVMYK